jgi:HSP20 family protein
MALVYRDPFEELQRELERMSGTAFEPFGYCAGVYPPVNVFDHGDTYVVKAELPGIDPERIEISVEDDTLTLRGERAFVEPSKSAAYHRRERGEGKFRRVVRLPGRVAGDETKAQYRNGVLTVTIPKAKEARPRRVVIEAA